MSDTNRATDQKIADAIGGTRVIHVTDQRIGTPLSWLNLVHDLKDRLVSSGGRPSDPHWDTKRLIPFRRQVWSFLSNEAKELSRTGRKVGPAQLAAIIIEDSLNRSKQFNDS
jgi:hypothetical protein